MRRRERFVLWWFGRATLMLAACVATGATASGALAQPSRIDRGVAAVLASGRPRLDPPGMASVVIELATGASVADVELVPGVFLERTSAGPVSWRSFVPARVDAAGLAALSTSAMVARVRLASPPGRPPLDVTTELVGLAAARAALAEGATGEGILIADLDTLIDIFHPAFFHADAGHFDWLDRNSDRVFSIGDAIDVDRDGLPGPTERATVLAASAYDEVGGLVPGVRRGDFDPSVDWLFLDVNGDGVRNVGTAAGWGDDAPGLGEPVFVPDDVNRNGRLDPAERVLELGTSKVRDVYLTMPDGSGGTTTLTFTRGAGLAAMERDYTGGSHGYADTLHGSAVAGILLGDVPLVGRRFVGMAPDAELVLVADFGRAREFGLSWALSQLPDVVLHEYVNWTDVLLDGSDPVSAFIDGTAADVAHICPAGNIGGRSKHVMAVLAAGETREISFRVAGRYPYLTVHVPVATNVGVVLIEPNGVEHDHSTGPFVLSTGERLYAWEIPSARTFDARSFAFDRSADALPWRLRIVGAPAASVTVHAYLQDDEGFAYSSAWVGAHDASTLAWPATADGCLAVAAVAGHASSEAPWFESRTREATGALRGFSGRGPRIDGRRSIGIAAPDNPWSPLGAGEVYPANPGFFVAPEGALQVFGGTSGAGPHVAGTAALLAQAGTRGLAALSAITGSAISDAVTGPVPNDGYGYGRLNAGAALGSMASASDPRVTLAASAVGVRVLVTPAVSDDDGDAMRVRWDVGYDGTWDTDFIDAEPRELDLPSGGLRVKVRARDATGRVGEAVLFVRTLSELVPPDAGPPDAGPVTAPPAGGCGCRQRGATSGWAALVLALVAVVGGRRPRR